MAYETMEQIRQSIRKLEEEIEAEGIDRSNKAVVRSVPFPLAWTIYKRLDPFIKYAVQYANIVDKSNEVIGISDDQMSWIRTHEQDIRLVNKSNPSLGLIALGLSGIYKALTTSDEYETAGELLQELVRYITMLRPVYAREYRPDTFLYDYKKSSKQNEATYREVEEEIERLAEEEYFRQQYEKHTEEE